MDITGRQSWAEMVEEVMLCGSSAQKQNYNKLEDVFFWFFWG